MHFLDEILEVPNLEEQIYILKEESLIIQIILFIFSWSCLQQKTKQNKETGSANFL